MKGDEIGNFWNLRTRPFERAGWLSCPLGPLESTPDAGHAPILPPKLLFRFLHDSIYELEKASGAIHLLSEGSRKARGWRRRTRYRQSICNNMAGATGAA
ncbi:hypothetical protein ACJRO7_035699 [Eucalyptus globulus]|uniref:Uncharacterized protein n=1 Tax=Eucalyptus globulus TaxID=34317 RepID=A0ABD3JB40_EUCGL